MPKYVKTAVSVPREEFRRLELLRRRNRMTRSEVFTQALRVLFKMIETRSLEERHARGYLRVPETELESKAFLKASLPILDKDGW